MPYDERGCKVMARTLAKLVILGFMLLGLPLCGIVAAGLPLGRYFEFPPRTLYVAHAPFSWLVFWGYVFFILLVTGAFLIRGLKKRPEKGKPSSTPRSFPWWGWCGVLLGVASWTLAWTRFDWFRDFQAHTFTPLWIAYILTANALTYRRAGTCLLVHRPQAYLLLFPASALFWWFFEYLNRFVQNWYYVGGQFTPWEYFWYATLAFSTVLPAFSATREFLLSFDWPVAKFQGFQLITLAHPRAMAAFVLSLSGLGLVGLGIWPDYLFSFLWMSPLLILVSLQTLLGERHIFSSLRQGDWSLLVCSAVAALICGCFWEMWNFYSLAKWKYQVPFVGRFHIFEMPLLGYAGYLPFGLECAVIVEMVCSPPVRLSHSMKRPVTLHISLFTLLFVVAWSSWASLAAATGKGDHPLCGILLQRFAKEGRVNYQGFKNEEARLGEWLRERGKDVRVAYLDYDWSLLNANQP